jgi:hypothetical protein
VDFAGSASISSKRSWTPANLAPNCWIYAAAEFVTLSGSSVSRIEDRSGNGNYFDQSSGPSQPTWEASGGWSASTSSILFSGHNLGNNVTPVFSFLNGADKAFSVLTTCQMTSYANLNTIISWDDSPTLAARNSLTIDTSQHIGFKREDDSTATKSGTAASPSVGTGHIRLVWVFSGTTMNCYVDGAVSLAASDGDLGTMTFARARIGDGIEAGSDTLNGRITEVVIVPRAILGSEVTLYQNYSIAEFN